MSNRTPRFVAVQSTGCAPLVRAWNERRTESVLWENPNTVAYGISVPKAIGDFIVLRILRETGGTAIAIPDDAIDEARRRIARGAGLLLCPEGAAAAAAADELRKSGWIHDGERVLMINTGSALKCL